MWRITHLKLLKIVAAGLLILLGLSADAQQDTQFTQFIFNGLSINPAYAGYKEDLFVQATYRSQWQGLTGAPKSFSVSADGTLTNKNVGLGLVVTNDQIGAQRYLSAFANYAYRLPLNYDGNQRLAFGIGVGLAQIGIDGSELRAIQGGDAIIPTGLQSQRLPDARFGIYYSDDIFFAGLSATNMLAKYFANNN
ncbi:MAG: type IX secretion system membrane protein PorP/SprF, partial [Pedobacter sp.]